MLTLSKLKKSFSIASDFEGLRFCIWVALKFDTFTEEPYNLVSDILARNKWHSIYWEALQFLNKNGILLTSDSVRALVRSYSHLGNTNKAIEVFDQMRELGVIPDARIYDTILRDVLRKRLFEFAFALYSTMVKSNVVPSFNTYNMLVDGYGKSGNIKGAWEVFDEMQKVNLTPNILLHTSVLYGICQAKDVDVAHKLFNQIKSDCPPDVVSCNVLLNGYCQMGRLDEALSFVRSMKRDGFSLNQHGYCSLINAFFRARRYSEAHAWYTRMFKEGIPLDVVTYAIMIRGLSDEGRVGEAARMLDEMTQIGLIPDVHCYNEIIKGLCDARLLNRAQSLRLKISERNVYTYTIIICEMCKSGMVDEAHELFDQIKKFGCVPSVVTFNVLINGLCKAHRLEEAIHLFSIMEMRHDPDLQEKVEQKYKAGQFLNAYRFLTLTNSMVSPDIITYNILIKACCEARDIEGAKDLLKKLRNIGLSPDSVTYGTLINTLYMIGKPEEAFNLFEHMQQVGCEPTLSAYKTVMTWLCRNGEVSRALNLYLTYLKSLPSQDNDSVSVVEKYILCEKLELVIRGLLELDFRARDFKLAPYTILLIGFCQAKKVNEAFIVFSVLDEFNITINATSCVQLIRGLCDERKLDSARKVFLYSLDKGFMLRPIICNHLLNHLLNSIYYKWAVDLIGRMKSFGYRIDSAEYRTIVSTQYQKRKQRKNVLIVRY